MILFSGGLPETSWKSVQYYSPDDWIETQCLLPELDAPKSGHTADGLVLCGGEHDKQHCRMFTSGSWITINDFFHSSRYHHSSWSVEDGVILIGGEIDSVSSELIQYNGDTQISFPVQTSVR